MTLDKDKIGGKSSSTTGWLEQRLPIRAFLKKHLNEYYAPKNLNFWYFFGSLALLVLVLQILTGIFLTMHYKPDSHLAFASVELIMRDVNWGWLIRYMHSVGASFFFAIVYLHIFRGIIYGSFKSPRELIWIIGMFIYVALMAEAFMGYLLPWGQMSYWGAQVIINLFGAIPYVGEDLATWIRGDFVVSDATLNRFFALHVIAVPLAILFLVCLHIIALHQVGSNNPQGVEISKNKIIDSDGKHRPVEGIPFHPYFTVKDMMGITVFFIIFSIVIFYIPEMGGFFLEANNFIEANPLVTPDHIAPLWYFTPFYTVLRAIPDAWYGVLGMSFSICVWFFLPWIDRNPIKSIRYRSSAYRINLAVFVAAFFALGYLGTQEVTPLGTEIALRMSEIYLLFFITLWMLSFLRPMTFRFSWFLVLVGLMSIYDTYRYISGASAIMILVGWILMLAWMFIMFIIPAFTSLAEDQEAPDRISNSEESKHKTMHEANG